MVAFFVPVDRQKTMIYLRFYVKMTGLKPVDSIIARLSMPLNRIILHQDRRVVETQERDIRKDVLVQGDLPIMEFRKRLYKEKKLIDFLFGGGQ